MACVSMFAALLLGCSTLHPVTNPPPSPTFVAPTFTPLNTATLQSTPQPLGSPSPTASPRPSAVIQPTAAASPQVISFTVAPTATAGLAQQIRLTWQAKGDQAEICGIAGNGPVDCQTVPLAGQKNIVTTAASAAYAQMGLRVTAGQSSLWSFVDVRLCKDATKYYFDYSGNRCPDGPALNSRGAAQNFQHGFMIWIQATDTSYAFYQEGGRTFESWTGPLHLLSGASVNNRVGGVPQGLYEPVSGFGLIWRGEVELSEKVRARLGWATAPEFGYDTAYQCEMPPMPHLWTCFLRDSRGKVLRLRPDSTAQVNFLWDEY